MLKDVACDPAFPPEPDDEDGSGEEGKPKNDSVSQDAHRNPVAGVTPVGNACNRSRSSVVQRIASCFAFRSGGVGAGSVTSNTPSLNVASHWSALTPSGSGTAR